MTSQALTGARIIEALRRAEDDPTDLGLAAHQIAYIIDIEEAEAVAICRAFVEYGLASEHLTDGGTRFWRYVDVDAQLDAMEAEAS